MKVEIALSYASGRNTAYKSEIFLGPQFSKVIISPFYAGPRCTYTKYTRPLTYIINSVNMAKGNYVKSAIISKVIMN